MNGIILFVIGMVVGCVLTLIFKPKKKPIKDAGDLILYKGENDEFMSLYLELNESPEQLKDCVQVTFNVKPTRI
jgi:hypothetical protein